MKKFRGRKYLTSVSSIDDFQKQFSVSDKILINAGAGEDYDANVIRKVLKKMAPNRYLVKYVDDKTGNTDGYFEIYTK